MIDVVPIGKTILPDDLVAPFGGDACCGLVWFASIRDVVEASLGIAPLVAPCCGDRFGVLDLGAVSFFSQAAWDAATDGRSPEKFRIGHAFKLDGAL